MRASDHGASRNEELISISIAKARQGMYPRAWRPRSIETANSASNLQAPKRASNVDLYFNSHRDYIFDSRFVIAQINFRDQIVLLPVIHVSQADLKWRPLISMSSGEVALMNPLVRDIQLSPWPTPILANSSCSVIGRVPFEIWRIILREATSPSRVVLDLEPTLLVGLFQELNSSVSESSLPYSFISSTH